MKITIEKNCVIQSTNLTTQQVVVEQARFNLKDAVAIVKMTNNTADAWLYEMVPCSEDN